jgi:hypothetical protein
MTTCTPLKPFRCGHCGESFPDGKAVDAHFSDHGPVCQVPLP